MNPRIIKEVRLLLWPWCLIVVAALLPLLSAAIRHFHELSSIFCGIGFFGGIPFLAALSLGGEFQQRTFALLLGQPVGRTRIWTEKQMVLLPALLAAVLLFWLSWPERDDLNGHTLTIVGAWLLATVSSAPFWTLVARSTVGGLVLGQVAQFGLGVVVVNVGLRLFGDEPSKAALLLAESIGVALWVGYSGWMLWLSRRKLLQFQATGGVAGDDLLMAGPRVLPAAVGDLLRCRATSPTFNLIRKELRLLRPLWLIMLLFLACWLCVVVTVRCMPQTEEWKAWREVLPMITISFYVPLAVILAGCLSLGEERSSGTHAWHLTLPVSIRRQWFIKLAMALGAGVFSAMVVPLLAVLAGQAVLNSPFGAEFKLDFKPADLPEYLIPVSLAVCASFPAFWCASAVNGAVRAALWVLPVMCALCFAGACGFWLAEQFKQEADVVMTMIVSRWQLNPLHVTNVTSTIMREDLWTMWLIFPTLVLAIFQSLRLFRVQPRDGVLPVIRRIAPLAVAAFICVLCFGTFVFSVERIHDSVLLNETRTAIVKLHIDTTKIDPAHPMKLGVGDLAQASSLSAATQQWLRTASFTVGPAIKGKKSWYQATIHFADGSEYPMTFRAGE